jgi:hypothetical protein
MPLLIILMQSIDIIYPSLKPVVPIAYKEHPTREELEVRVSSQLGLKFIICSSLVRAPIAHFLITYRVLFPELIADGDIEHASTRPVSMDELSLQPLDVIGKSWTD